MVITDNMALIIMVIMSKIKDSLCAFYFSEN